MKNFKLILMVILCITWISSQAQTWSITHNVAAGEKIAANVLLGEEISLINEQKHLVDELRVVEQDYDSRRKLNSNFKSLPMMIATIGAIEFSEKQINEIEEKIKDLKGKRLYTKLRLKEHEVNLTDEKRYLQEIKSEYTFLLTAISLSGGPGYNYSAFLKVLIRTLKIRRNILLIEYKVNNLITQSNNIKR
ncbi:hypothetical protein [Zobellia galactanivorans]|nr:hypothetical protein [Zobellia galactanivorans]